MSNMCKQPRRTLICVSVVAIAGVLVAAGSTFASELYWTPAHELAPQGMCTRMAVGDLDDDGDLDLSLLGVGYHYWNTGSPQVPVWQLDTAVYQDIQACAFRAGALGDVDADGDLDLIISCDDEYLRFYWNIGTPQVPLWEYDPAVLAGFTFPGGGAQVRLPDFDADGDLDVVLMSAFGSLRWLRNVGTPSAPEWAFVGYIEGITIADGAYPNWDLADLDGDGDLDVVRITWDTPLECWENTGTPEAYEYVANQSMLNGVDEPSDGGFGVVIFDVDADGDTDLMIADPYAWWNLLYLNEGSVPVERSTWGRVKAMYR